MKLARFDLLAEVFALHFNYNTHLLQAGAHAFADAVAEGFFAHGGAWATGLYA